MAVMLFSARADYGAAITLHTTIYETYGASNDFTILLGSSESGDDQVIEYDCGTGSQEAILKPAYTTTDEDGNTVTNGTYLSCRVNSEGIVRIYMDDPNWIDWFNADGCYIDWIEFDGVTDLVYFSMSHNELKSLDLSNMTKIQTLYVSDNPFTDSPLIIGPKENLKLLEINNISGCGLDPNFTLRDYPTIWSLDAWNAKGLTTIDASMSPYLRKLSLDGTDVSSIDVTKNPFLQILNISDTRITSLDVSQNTALTQLYCTHESSINSEYKLDTLDVSNNPELYYLFCTGNNLKTLDISKNTKLGSLTARKNYLTELNVDNNPELFCVNISDNCFGYATLPYPYDSTGNDRWGEYDYAQRELDTDYSYPVGAVLDYSDKMLRTGTDTQAVLYGTSEDSPGEIKLIDTSYYEYSNGKVTLKGIPTSDIYGTNVDSVYVEFNNSLFTEANIRTKNFKVKSTEDYGKPTQMIYFTSEAYVGSGKNIIFSIGMQEATEEKPKTFYVDFGDGNLVEYKATTIGLPATATVNHSPVGGYVRIYTNDGDEISSFAVEDLTLYSLDLSAAHCLANLTLKNTNLYSLDLQWNRCLENIDVNGNNLSSFTLAANNQGYGKNALHHVNLANNKMSEFEWNENYTVTDLDLSNNNLSTLSLGKNTVIEKINIANNKFDYLNIEDCAALTDLNISGNIMSTLTMPTENVVERLNISNNLFTFATMPDVDLAEENYIYAPQSVIDVPGKGPGVNLTDQNIDDATAYVWSTTDGQTLEENVDYTNDGGKIRFITTGLKAFCSMSNPKYPAFSGDNALRTSVIETADMPTHVIAEFETAEDGEAIITLTSTVANNSVFVDWTGNDDLTQYMLGTTYTIYNADTYKGAKVKVYSYDENDNVSVFSLRGAKLNAMNAASLKNLICFNCSNAGLSEITLPDSPNLGELILEDNNLSSFDFAKYPKLYYLNLAQNKFTNVDLSVAPNLQQVFLSNNELTNITLGENNAMFTFFAANNQLSDVDLSKIPNVYQMDLSYNNFESLVMPAMNRLNVFYISNNLLTSVDFSKSPTITQLNLAGNELESVDISTMPNLIALSLANNKFRFSTLPVVSDSFRTYIYYPQADIEVSADENRTIDLSAEAVAYDAEGTAYDTQYYWLIGEPNYDSEDNIINEMLESETDNADDPEYTVANGVNTFCYDQTTPITGMMTNEAFSDLILFTNTITVTSGVESVTLEGGNVSVKVNDRDIIFTSAEATTARIYTVNGMLYRTLAVDGIATATVEPGIYAVVIGNQAVKVIVK
jgi:hypothetical protein